VIVVAVWTIFFKLLSLVFTWVFDSWQHGFFVFFVFWAVFVITFLGRTNELLEQIRKSIDAKGK